MIGYKEILEIYKQKYGAATLHVSAPGRANIIGEHTDYNDGYVLPFAIDKRVYFSAGTNKEDHFKIYSVNRNKEITLFPSQTWDKGFGRFFSSVIQVLTRYEYELSGLNIVFGGDLPIGGGMSSSSSITCGFIAMLNHQFDLGLSKIKMVELAVESEHGIGVEGGAMDQYSIIFGETNKAILLDCMTKTSELLTINLGDYVFCLFDTNVSHNLADTEYNTRSRSCKGAKVKIRKKYKEINNFREVTDKHLDVLTDREAKRVTHVLAENQRVLSAVKSFQNEDLKAVGVLLNQSHYSLRDLYEVSCPELDFLQASLIQSDRVLGARMMGGGFGGSVIGLLHKDSLKEIAIKLEADYRERFDLQLEVYPIKPEAGLAITTGYKL